MGSGSYEDLGEVCGTTHYYYGECVRHLNVKIGEHIGISPLTKKKVELKGSVVIDHLLLCNHSPSFESFSEINKQDRKFVKPSLNRNIRFAPLYLLDRVQLM